MALLFECLVLPPLLVLALLGVGPGRALRAPFAQLARRRSLAFLVVGATALGFSAASSLIGGCVPTTTDEFSYLLAADTFAHGRLTNPPHPLWKHFETFHVLQQPSYQSKYPPGQGLALAAGQVLTGRPIVGAWLSFALACSALCWMLQAWVRPRWALVGGLLAATHVGLVTYWGGSYWGGAVAMLGGALLFGALRRLAGGRIPRARDAVLLALGLIILANSRPYEGFIVSLPAAAVLLAWAVRRTGPRLGVTLTRVVLPAAAVLALGAAATGFYNYRVTGDPLRMPYLAYEAQYAGDPSFLWQFAAAREREQQRSESEQLSGLPRRRIQEEPLSEHAQGLLHSSIVQWLFFFRLALLLPLAALPWILRTGWLRFAALTCGLLWLAIVPTALRMPHYFAPVTGLGILLLVQCLRHLRLGRLGGRRVGRLLAWGIPLVCVGSLLCALAESARYPWVYWGHRRAALCSRLESEGGRHLVIVRYAPDHDRGQDWVYNAADIDTAEVVWARELTPEQNRKLLDYFRSRRVWLLEPDVRPSRLSPYSPSPHGN